MTITKKGLTAIAIVSGILLVYKVLVSLWAFLPFPFFNGSVSPEASSVGIIGGADGPTAIFLTTHITSVSYFLLVILPFIVETLIYLFAMIFSIRALRRGKA